MASNETQTAIELRMKLEQRTRELQPTAIAMQEWFDQLRVRFAEKMAARRNG